MAILDNSHKKVSLFVANKELNPVAEFVRSSYGLTAEQCFYNTRIKHYPGFDKILCCCKPIFNPYKLELSNKSPKKSKSKVDYNREPQERADSIKRSQDKLRDIAYANSDILVLFVTLTLSPEKIDRYDKNKILTAVSDFFKNCSKRHDIKGLIVAEEHKDGAIHFHGLMAIPSKYLIDSGLKHKDGRIIYNFSLWHKRFGFTNVIYIDESYSSAVNYVCKYITKNTKKIFGKRYFAFGKGLKREVPTEYFNTDYCDFDGKEYQPSEVGLKFKYKDIWEENNGEIDLFD